MHDVVVLVARFAAFAAGHAAVEEQRAAGPEGGRYPVTFGREALGVGANGVPASSPRTIEAMMPSVRASATTMRAPVKVARRAASEQNGDVGEQHQEVGRDQRNHHTRELVVVAEAHFVDRSPG